jgi:hypothetical protein
VINYDPAKSEVFQFWLFSTGYREARRSKLTLQEILAQNSSMLRKQKLNSILTTKKEKLLRLGIMYWDSTSILWILNRSFLGSIIIRNALA